MKEWIARDLENENSDPYDTHPCLRERVNAIKLIASQSARVTSIDRSSSCPSAISLLDNVPELELLLLAHISDGSVDAFKPLDWEEVGDKVYIPLWQKNAQKFRAPLAGKTIATLPKLIEAPESLVKAICDAIGHPVTQEQLIVSLSTVLSSAFTAALIEQGWTLDYRSGAYVALCKETHRIEPFELVWQLLRKELTDDDWPRLCQESSILDLPLVS